MRDSTCHPPEQLQNRPVREAVRRPGIGGSIAGACVLLALDGAFYGSFLTSILVCPVWILVSLVRSAALLPGWWNSLVRIAIPALTLILVYGNDALQMRIGRANADRIILACEQFHSDYGRYPRTLADLVPRYLDEVPRAKYCVARGEFWYIGGEKNHMLVWWVVPPFGTMNYNFELARWRFSD
jgi:hypothetical protein